MKWFRRKKETPIDPLQKLKDLTDEFNETIKELRKDENYKMIRPWVRSGDLRTRARPKLMLGYWDRDGECFIAIHGEE